MAISQVTKSSTEADLEARIATAMRLAFAWLPADGLKHQLKFTFKFGHSAVTVNSAEVSAANARLDILVTHRNMPLAVMELKRNDLALTKEDEEQGLSYARMLDPRPPLVVITNGSSTKFLETHTGTEWKSNSPSEAEVHKLIGAAGKLAAGDLKRAIETLLGPESDLWIQALRVASDQNLNAMTGSFDEVTQPFVRNFLIPRNATRHVIDALSKDKRVVIVQGPPLAGKSNVLRELVELTRSSKNYATLFVEADGAAGVGLLQSIANVMADSLGWHVTVEDTRAWLRSVSRQSCATLVLAIDGLSTTHKETRRDIEELSGDEFGPNIRLVLAVDDTVTPTLTLNETRRKATRIGRRATLVTVEALQDNEFQTASNVLQEHRIGIIQGGEHAHEYRVPWVIRALASHITSSPRYADESVMANLPPLLGPQLLFHVRERFGGDEIAQHLLQAFAEAVLEDVTDRRRSVSTVLESMANYAVQRKTVNKYLNGDDLKSLCDRGLVKLGLSLSHEQVVVAKLPELLASEIAHLLASRLAETISKLGPVEGAKWLVDQSSRLPLGDVISAQAIIDYAMDARTLSLAFIEQLLSVPPRKEKIKAGTKAALFMPKIGKVELTFREDGRIVARIGPHEKILDAEEDDDSPEMYADLEGWLILSHLAGHPFEAQSKDGTRLGRVDPALLMEVGTCPMVLRRPHAEFESGIIVHNMVGHGSIVCHDSGIVEPITLSILKFVSTTDDLDEVSEWLHEAVDRSSLPLIARLDIALRHLADGGDKAGWARTMLAKTLKTALAKFPPLH